MVIMIVVSGYPSEDFSEMGSDLDSWLGSVPMEALLVGFLSYRPPLNPNPH